MSHLGKHRGSKELSPSTVDRKAPHPSRIAKHYKSSVSKPAFRSPLERMVSCPSQIAETYRIPVARRILGSPVKPISPDFPQSIEGHRSPSAKHVPQTSTKINAVHSSNSAPRRVARLSKKHVYHDFDRKPVFTPYSKCLCDIEQDSDGEDKLSRAQFSGTAIHILQQDGTEAMSCPHLRDCARYSVKYPICYDPTTIARDILRAIGEHPCLPALNQHWNEKLASDMHALGE